MRSPTTSIPRVCRARVIVAPLATLLFVALGATSLAASPKRGALYTGTTRVGPWSFSFGGYMRGTTVPGPNVSLRVTSDGKHVVKLKTTPSTLGEPGYCGGDTIQSHQPKITIRSTGRFSGKLVQTSSSPTFGSYTVTTTVSGRFTGSGKTTTGKFQILSRFPDPRQQCDEHGTFRATTK